MRNVLFIGDLTTAYNYGAIATSESLMDLFRKKIDDEHFKTIDSRSFYSETPIDGWPEYKLPIYRKKNRFFHVIERALRKYGLTDAAKALLRKNENIEKCHVPVRFSEYDSFTQDVLCGKKLPFEKALVEWADIVVINSEGNIVNGTDKNGVYRFGGLYVLYMAYFSKLVMNKSCYIINHTVDPANRDIQEIITNLYPLMDGIYVREKLSEAMLRSWGVSNQKYVPDALFSHDFTVYSNNDDFKSRWKEKIDFSKPYICLGDSSGIHNKYNKVNWNVEKTYNILVKELKSKVCNQIIFIDGFSEGNDDTMQVMKEYNLTYVNLNNCSYHELYYVLKNADLFISGRWHASIISLKAHTPILLFGSDSHKTEALYHEIDWPFYFFDTKTVPLNISRICDEAKKILEYDCTDVWKKVDELSEAARHNVDFLN